MKHLCTLYIVPLYIVYVGRFTGWRNEGHYQIEAGILRGAIRVEEESCISTACRKWMNRHGLSTRIARKTRILLIKTDFYMRKFFLQIPKKRQ